MSTTAVPDPDLQRQREYAKHLQQEGFDYTVTVADAFVRGIRDLGYRNTARAIDEQVDNAIQAGADRVAIVFGFHGKKKAEPTEIAVVDNGHGMDPEMLRLSVIWGGTHREGDRTGFGRYGWGLPSSSVSMGRRFTVYSTVDGTDLRQVTMDLDEIAEGHHTHDGKIRIPEPSLENVPAWLEGALPEAMGFPNTHGTAVVVSKLDRLSWKTATGIERNLLQHLGLTYRNFLRDVAIIVNGKRVEPIDPLFITPGYRFYDLDEDRAEPAEPLEFEMKGAGERRGVVNVRFSYMPPTFARIDKMASPRARNNNNARFNIISENNGIIVLRERRQIDVVSKGPWLSVNNDDRYWGVEVDLPASLDEEMSITTSKQQVVLSEHVWQQLRSHGVLAAIRDFRKRYDLETGIFKKKREDAQAAEETARASEKAMADSEKFNTRRPIDTARKRARRQEELEREVNKRAEETGASPEKVKKDILAEVKDKPYRVRTEHLPGSPFYRMQQLGGQRILFLNTAHRFFSNVYTGAHSTPWVRAAFETLLFAIGTTELDGNDERQMFYEMEKPAWSERLSAALQIFEEIDSSQDARLKESDDAERREQEQQAEEEHEAA